MLKRIRVFTLLFFTALIIGIAVYLLYGIEGSGFGAFGAPGSPDFEREKTLWSWLELLIVPAILAFSVIFFNEQARVRQRTSELDRFREETLQKYLDSMAELLIDNASELDKMPAHIRSVALLRTVTVLRRLDTTRMQEVINFLQDSHFLSNEIALLKGARLTEIDLSELKLSLLNLQGADFTGSKMRGIDLSGSNLSEADFTLVDLTGSNLNDADLTDADLSGATLTGAYLSQAKLLNANIGNTTWTDATLPDDKSWTPETDMSQYTGQPA